VINACHGIMRICTTTTIRAAVVAYVAPYQPQPEAPSLRHERQPFGTPLSCALPAPECNNTFVGSAEWNGSVNRVTTRRDYR
jgi:hypothetical protein